MTSEELARDIVALKLELADLANELPRERLEAEYIDVRARNTVLLGVLRAIAVDPEVKATAVARQVLLALDPGYLPTAH